MSETPTGATASAGERPRPQPRPAAPPYRPAPFDGPPLAFRKAPGPLVGSAVVGFVCGGLSAMIGIGMLLLVVLGERVEHDISPDSTSTVSGALVGLILLDLAVAVGAIGGASRMLNGSRRSRLLLVGALSAFAVQGAVWFILFCADVSDAGPVYYLIPLVLFTGGATGVVLAFNGRSSAWLAARRAVRLDTGLLNAA